jgi:hypothetical protein
LNKWQLKLFTEIHYLHRMDLTRAVCLKVDLEEECLAHSNSIKSSPKLNKVVGSKGFNNRHLDKDS